ncbi:MAG: FAD binding domain-containing protein [Anaerolineae bacterium]|jgi:carbon-monoxide dehydrogenase medium subunit|nr:FAD binding domain-containing protein [Anaerolineae bacterium]MDH7474454.1 FAD binding domain-containing protein [Anaerolineae bacterium]
MWQNYLFPATVQEALELLAHHGGQARIIAGGTDLVLQSQRGQCAATVMIDITRIPGLDAIEERDGYITIGCQVTHARIAASPLIRQKAEVLALACGSVGGPQTRNVGTLVGNVVNALPAADGAVALFALEAEVEMVDASGRRWLPIAEMYAGVGECTINPCAQLVTTVRFRPLSDGWASAYQRLANRKALALPILNTAVVVGLEDGVCREVRIAIGPVAPTPFRAREAEAALVGQTPDAEAIVRAARLAADAADPRDSILRGSRDYRKAMVEVLVRRALTEAVTKAMP